MRRSMLAFPDKNFCHTLSKDLSSSSLMTWHTKSENLTQSSFPRIIGIDRQWLNRVGIKLAVLFLNNLAKKSRQIGGVKTPISSAFWMYVTWLVRRPLGAISHHLPSDVVRARCSTTFWPSNPTGHLWTATPSGSFELQWIVPQEKSRSNVLSVDMWVLETQMVTW